MSDLNSEDLDTFSAAIEAMAHVYESLIDNLRAALDALLSGGES